MSKDSVEYSIQEVSEKLGVPVQKLRRWDAQGVLVARRTDGGHRRYANTTAFARLVPGHRADLERDRSTSWRGADGEYSR